MFETANLVSLIAHMILTDIRKFEKYLDYIKEG